MNIALVICPWYSGGTSAPLGLAYINRILVNLLQNTFPFDMEFLLVRDNPTLIRRINWIFGLPAHDPRKVMFLIRPELLLFALFPKEYKNYSIPASKSELEIIEKIRKKLGMYVDQLLNERKY